MHVHQLSVLGETLELITPSMVELSICINVAGWPISCNMHRICMASFALMNNVPNLASAADDITASYHLSNGKYSPIIWRILSINILLALFVKQSTQEFQFDVLSFCAVCWSNVRMRRVLQLQWSFMPKLLQCLGDVPGHWLVNLPVGVVPIKGNANVFTNCPILNFIMLLESTNQMNCILVSDIFHPKIINDKCERDRACLMSPQAQYCLTLWVPVLI